MGTDHLQVDPCYALQYAILVICSMHLCSGTGFWNFDCVGGDIVCDTSNFLVGCAEEAIEGMEEGGYNGFLGNRA